MRNRAFRRHCEQRQKQRARFKITHIWGDWHLVGNARFVGRIAQMRSHCSCSMCGNPRRHFGLLTVQELRANQAPMECYPVIAKELANESIQ